MLIIWMSAVNLTSISADDIINFGIRGNIFCVIKSKDNFKGLI